MSSSLDYRVLKSAIIKSAEKNEKTETGFTINFDKLRELVKDYNLKPLPVSYYSFSIQPYSIPAISEYYSKSDMLAWFNEDVSINYVIFVDISKADDNLKDLLNKLDNNENGDYDETNITAQIVSYYPCYFALISSYVSNNPKFIGKNSYNISCRANKVVIKDPEYTYEGKKKKNE